MYAREGKPMKQLVVFTALLWAGNTIAATSTGLTNCAGLSDDRIRLACYDAAAGREAAPEPPADSTVTLETVAAGTADNAESDQPEFVSRRHEEEQENANNRFVIIPYQRNYLLPITYNSNINEEAWDIAYPDEGMDKAEVKFQISMKAIIWQDMFGKDMDLWGAYTQTNWMQAYNTDASSPFRETNYEPELILSIPNDWHFLGVHNTRLDFSFNHQSNGTSEPLSRSWNRLIASALFEHRNFSLATSAWYRIPEGSKDDDNPDIDKYMGHGQLQGVWKWPDYTLGFTFRNNLRSNNKGAIQLDWTFPISQRFSGYIQYFNGYGESLIDYNESSNRIGIGVSITDPF
jgi:phospholipase A1